MLNQTITRRGPRVGELCIGVVIPRTGRLAKLGDPLSFVVELLAPKLRQIINGRRRWEVRLACRDSRSEPGAAREAAAELIDQEQAQVVVTMAGTRVLPAVADICEALDTPCVSTTFPWQAYFYGRGAEPEHPFRSTYHFAWGLDDVAAVFAEMWEHVGANLRVGCLWNDDRQGEFLRRPGYGFLPAAASHGHMMIDPGGYHEPALEFSRHITEFLDAGVDVVTYAGTPEDLALFCRQAARRALRPKLITSSRWLAYPTRTLCHTRIATVVYWTPRHPFRSSLDGTSPADLAQLYEQASGNHWLQPLGLAYALIEVAAHALSIADDPTDRAAVAEALGRTRLHTMAGLLDWTAGPVLNVALVRLVGGQWQPGRMHPVELRVVTNSRFPEVLLDGQLQFPQQIPAPAPGLTYQRI